MIKIKGQKDYVIALESVAMTDIVMNMFIFFFISFSLLYTLNAAKVSKIEVRLPKANTAVALEGSEKVVLGITRGGQYFIDDSKIPSSKVKTALEARLKENPGLSVVLKVDEASKFSALAHALDILNELKIDKVSVAAVKNDEGIIK